MYEQYALTKGIGDRFSVTKGASWTKPIHSQKIIKKESLSMLLFQQPLFPLQTTN